MFLTSRYHKYSTHPVKALDRAFAKGNASGLNEWRAKKPPHRGRLNLMPKRLKRLTTYERTYFAVSLPYPFLLVRILATKENPLVSASSGTLR